MSQLIDGIDYGPLRQLIGTWSGSKGMDTSPEMDGGTDRNPYTEEITFTPAGSTDNAEEQELVAVKYHQVVKKQSNGKIFHDQIGHWLYEPATGLLMQSISIPRGVCLLAGGKILEKDSQLVFSVEANIEDSAFGIVQSPFMERKAKTKAYRIDLKLSEYEMSYHQTTSLYIYGKDFEHSDKSQLTKVVYNG